VYEQWSSKTFLPTVHFFAETGKRLLTDGLGKVKGKVKFTLGQPKEIQRGSRGVALLFL